MPKGQENIEEISEENEVEETEGQEATEVEQDESSPANLLSELRELKGQNAQITQALSKLFEAKNPQAETPAFTDAEVAEMAKNPAAIAKIFARHTENSIKQINNVSQGKVWDSRAYKEFPTLETDQKFQNAVVSKIREMVAAGDMAGDSPRLMYYATKMVAQEYMPSKATKIADGKSNTSSEAPRTGRPAAKRAAIPDNDPRLRVGRMLFGNDPKKLEALKERLEPRAADYEPRIKKGRTLVR